MTAPSIISRFGADFLRRAARGGPIQKVRQHAYRELGIAEGHTVLDIGCGPGTTTIELALLFGDASAIVGIDHDPELVRAANLEAAQQSLDPRVSHFQQDARQLAFADATFNAVYCERVLQHLSRDDGRRAIEHALRVLKPGGRICIIDTDWTTLSIDAQPFGVERALVSMHWQRHVNPSSGRQLAGLLSEFGVSGVKSIPFVNARSIDNINLLLAACVPMALQRGLLKPPDIAAFRQSLETAARADTFNASAVSWVASGTKVP